MSIGGPEIIVLFLLALIVFGPRKLPEIGRNLGQAMRELRRMSSEVTSVFEEALDDRRRASSYGQEWQHPEDENYHYPPGEPADSETVGDTPEDPYADVYSGEDLAAGSRGGREEAEASPESGELPLRKEREAAAERTD
ncbi:MAG: hypothetical protein KatS3mg024_1097 [Armatimonadota bacterium]|nr:MAG: hypothetical protein KatS3mg024_1097 [Armatimonadota bacterium]